jgi:hypothetical protein
MKLIMKQSNAAPNKVTTRPTTDTLVNRQCQTNGKDAARLVFFNNPSAVVIMFPFARNANPAPSTEKPSRARYQHGSTKRRTHDTNEFNKARSSYPNSRPMPKYQGCAGESINMVSNLPVPPLCSMTVKGDWNGAEIEFFFSAVVYVLQL